jgi:mRNA interferase HigB
MRILGENTLQVFKRKHSTARKPLDKWEIVVSKGAWKSFSELKKTFNSADYIEGKTVFDVGGNKYRVIAVVQYAVGLVIVSHVLTHEEYDKGKWK